MRAIFALLAAVLAFGPEWAAVSHRPAAGRPSQTANAAALASTCVKEKIDLRITVDGADVFGESCAPVLQRNGDGAIGVELDLERADPSIWQHLFAPGFSYSMQSYAITGLGLGRPDLVKNQKRFEIDLASHLPDSYDDPAELSTTTLGSVYLTGNFNVTRIADGQNLGSQALAASYEVSVPFAFYKQVSSHVEIDSYLRKMTVKTFDIVIEGSAARLVGRAGVKVAPQEQHVLIYPEEAKTDANGAAVFDLYPYPPLSNDEGRIYAAQFSFGADLKDGIRPQNAQVYFAKATSLRGDVQGTAQGDIVGQNQTVTLGSSIPTGSGNVFPAVQFELNDRTLVKLASRNDAVANTSVDLGLDPTQRHRLLMRVNASPETEGEAQSWFEWSAQRIAVKGLLSLTPWGFGVQFASGIVINYVLDHTLYGPNTVLSAGQATSLPFGAFSLSGGYRSDGSAYVDNLAGSSPILAQTPAGSVIVAPGARFTYNNVTGATSITNVPAVCTFPHDIAITTVSGPTVDALTSRNPEIAIAHTPCDYLEESLQVWVDGQPGEYDARPIDGYTLLKLRGASVLSPGPHVLRAVMTDQDGALHTTSRTVTVTQDAGIDAPLPVGLAALAGRTSVGLRWQGGDPGLVAGYNVYRRIGGGPASMLTTQPISLPVYFDTSLGVGAIGNYTVTAVSVTGRESPGSATVAATLVPTAPLAPPPPVTRLTATVSGYGVDLRFDTGMAAGWRVERGASPAGPFSPLAGSAGLVTLPYARDSAAAPGATSWYRVTSVGVDGLLGTPAVVGPVAVTDVAPPPVPALTGYNQGNRAVLSWQPVRAPDVAGYHVYRASRTSGFIRLTASPISSTVFTDPLGAAQTPAWYRLTTVDAAGQESILSYSILVSYAVQPWRAFLPTGTKALGSPAGP